MQHVPISITVSIVSTVLYPLFAVKQSQNLFAVPTQNTPGNGTMSMTHSHRDEWLTRPQDSASGSTHNTKALILGL